MPWARVDDTAHEHRKFKRAGLEATGLYYMALSYCARYLTDGRVDFDWLEERVPSKGKRDKLLDTLVENGLFEPNGVGYVIHDYLEVNPSRSEVEGLRDKRAAAGKAGGQANGKQV
jgi:hypothetical protein